MTFVLQVNGEIMPEPVASSQGAELFLHVNLTCWWSGVSTLTWVLNCALVTFVLKFLLGPCKC